MLFNFLVRVRWECFHLYLLQGMLLEFAAFIKMRIKKPELHWPYRVPLQTFGAALLCLPPATLLVLVMCLTSMQTFQVSGVVGFLLFPTLVHPRIGNKKILI